MRFTNYPPGVTGNEPEIAGEEEPPEEHRLTVDGTCTCGFTSHKVRSVRIHITKANTR